MPAHAPSGPPAGSSVSCQGWERLGVRYQVLACSSSLQERGVPTHFPDGTIEVVSVTPESPGSQQGDVTETPPVSLGSNPGARWESSQLDIVLPSPS